MNTVDRVMRAYCRIHPLTDVQATFVRQELATFIDRLIAEGPISACADTEQSGGGTDRGLARNVTHNEGAAQPDESSGSGDSVRKD